MTREDLVNSYRNIEEKNIENIENFEKIIGEFEKVMTFLNKNNSRKNALIEKFADEIKKEEEKENRKIEKLKDELEEEKELRKKAESRKANNNNQEFLLKIKLITLRKNFFNLLEKCKKANSSFYEEEKNIFISMSNTFKEILGRKNEI